MKSKTENIIELIIKARNEAIERGIRANSIKINEKLCYVKPFNLKFANADGSTSIEMFKSMIIGLEIDVEHLPADMDFIVYEADKTYNQKLKEQIERETLEYWIRYLYQLWKTFGQNDPQFILQNLQYIAKQHNFSLEGENVDE